MRRARSLIKRGADVNAQDDTRQSAYLVATSEGFLELLDLTLEHGADPDALDDRHNTQWLVTGVTGSVATANVVLPTRPDLGIRNRFGSVSLIPATERGHVDYVRRVVKTGIDVDHVNDLGWTALLEAVILGDGSQRYQDVVATLLAAGADRRFSDLDGVTALEHAQRREHAAIVDLLRS